MNITTRLVVLSASAVLAAAGAAFADDQPLRQLLQNGYTIVGTTLVPSDVGVRAMANEGWKDELLITLARGDSVAFCHTLLAATVNNDSVLDVGCFVPAGTPPASSSQTPPADTSSSSEPPADPVSSSEAPPVAPPPDTKAPPPATPVPTPPAQ